jgi:hypothetical protein
MPLDLALACVSRNDNMAAKDPHLKKARTIYASSAEMKEKRREARAKFAETMKDTEKQVGRRTASAPPPLANLS